MIYFINKMTICIGGICNNGKTVILAADSMLTNEGLSIEFEHPTKKMTPLGERCVALTAGDALAHTELFDMVQQRIMDQKSPSVVKIVETVKECYQKIRQREIRERILMPRGFDDFGDFYEMQRQLHPDIVFQIDNEIARYDYGLQILIGGITGGLGHLYGISDPGTSQCYDAIGFHAIGSGLPHAINTLIAHGFNQYMSTEEALLIMYAAKKFAEKAPGVGSGITDICILEQEGVFELPRDSLDKLGDFYGKWLRGDPSWKDDVTDFLKDVRGANAC